MPKMSDLDLKAVCAAKIQNSLGWQGGRLAQERLQAERFYRGEKFGNEGDGRSEVVSRDVAEAVDSMMPSLMRVLKAGLARLQEQLDLIAQDLRMMASSRMR